MDTTDFKRDDLPPLPPDEAARRRDAFFKVGGANLRMLMQFAENLPETGVTIKDAQGYIYFKNRRALELMNLSDDSSVIGHRSQHLYPRRLWRVYIDREEPTLRTGEPMIDKVYGYVADLSTALNRVSVFPVRDTKGRIIGLMTSHYRAGTTPSRTRSPTSRRTTPRTSPSPPLPPARSSPPHSSHASSSDGPRQPPRSTSPARASTPRASCWRPRTCS